MTSALTEIERLIVKTAKKAQEEDIELEKKVDALKILAPYYALLQKAKLKMSAESGEFSLSQLASQIHEADDEGSNGRNIQDRASGRN